MHVPARRAWRSFLSCKIFSSNSRERASSSSTRRSPSSLTWERKRETSSDIERGVYLQKWQRGRAVAVGASHGNGTMRGASRVEDRWSMVGALGGVWFYCKFAEIRSNSEQGKLARHTRAPGQRVGTECRKVYYSARGPGGQASGKVSLAVLAVVLVVVVVAGVGAGAGGGQGGGGTAQVVGSMGAMGWGGDGWVRDEVRDVAAVKPGCPGRVQYSRVPKVMYRWVAGALTTRGDRDVLRIPPFTRINFTVASAASWKAGRLAGWLTERRGQQQVPVFRFTGSLARISHLCTSAPLHLCTHGAPQARGQRLSAASRKSKHEPNPCPLPRERGFWSRKAPNAGKCLRASRVLARNGTNRERAAALFVVDCWLLFPVRIRRGVGRKVRHGSQACPRRQATFQTKTPRAIYNLRSHQDAPSPVLHRFHAGTSSQSPHVPRPSNREPATASRAARHGPPQASD
ncbi:hypothetical protein F4780DRAFT_632103 [Xylariomycetidae sp. FL0641]|nr:hypothetical protein F4780DRAFT_632103 [Xylariomycetidae sp. FL0641]